MCVRASLIILKSDTMLKKIASELNHLSIEKDDLGFPLQEFERLAQEWQEEEDDVDEAPPKLQVPPPVIPSDDSQKEQTSTPLAPLKKLIVEM